MPPHVVQNIVEMVITAVSVLSFTGIVAWTIVRSRRPSGSRPNVAGGGVELAAMQERLARLEQAVDAVAVEVERSGEAQRFTARLLAERLGEPAQRTPDRMADHASSRVLAPHNSATDQR